MACLGHMISNDRRIAVTRQRSEMFRFPVLLSTLQLEVRSNALELELELESKLEHTLIPFQKLVIIK